MTIHLSTPAILHIALRTQLFWKKTAHCHSGSCVDKVLSCSIRSFTSSCAQNSASMCDEFGQFLLAHNQAVRLSFECLDLQTSHFLAFSFSFHLLFPCFFPFPFGSLFHSFPTNPKREQFEFRQRHADMHCSVVSLHRCQLAGAEYLFSRACHLSYTQQSNSIKQPCHSCGTGPTALRLFHLTLSMLSDPKKVTGVGLC